MATISGGTIGTGGTYPDIASWWAACPADLVAADVVWQGRLLNQEFTGTGNILTISGKTTDATRYIELTAAAGASFKDHASKATNPLRYNAAVGAAIRMTGDYAVAIQITQAYTRISNIQFAGSSQTANAGTVLQVSGSATNCDINGCIIEGYSNDRPFRMAGTANVIRNSLVIQRRPSAIVYILDLTNGAQAYNCTLVSTGAKLNTGMVTQYAVGVLKNCYVGNVTAPRDSGTAPTITTSYSDGTGTGFLSAPFSTATFVNVTDGTHDFRLAPGSALIDVGTADATYSATGIIGTARPQGAGYDVGAWEYTAAASTPVAFSGPVPTRNGVVGAAASFANAGFFAGSATPFAYSSVGTALPAGLTLSSSTGIISGTPTAAGTSSGIVVRATDANNATADTNAYSIVIAASNAAPTFPGSIANITGTAGTAITPVNVSGQFSDSDALTYSASPAGTAWPSGLTIDSSTGIISGTVSQSTTTGLKVRATDTASQTVDSNTFSVTISAAQQASGTITWPFPIVPINGDARLSAGHRIAVCNMTTDALVVRKTGLVTHASTGIPPAISDALIVAGTQYRCHLILDSDNAASGTEVITAT